MYQRQFQKIQHQTTAHLAQTMTLLSMNNIELSQEIERALNDNPALELSDERVCPQCNRRIFRGQICPRCSQPKDIISDDSVVFLSSRSDFFEHKGNFNSDDISPEEISSKKEELPTFVLRQIVYDLEEDEQKIAAYLVNLINEDGFILEDDINAAQYFHVPLSRIIKVKKIIQGADPIGIGASSPKEAMLIQLQVLANEQDIPQLTESIVENYLEDLSKKNFDVISKALEIEEENVKEVAEFISKNLNPFPARAYWGSSTNTSADIPETYSKPDVIIRHMNNDPNLPLIIEVILPYGGRLQLNLVYKNALKEANSNQKTELKTDLDKANLFIKCLKQRNNTMRRLMEKISKVQKDFILEGNKHITPLTRAELAKELDVHESTISRAVASKSVQMPDGKIIPMSVFFDRSLGVRSELKDIIENENSNHPMSDTKLANELEKRGYKVARRTVAKYRSMEGILPAYMRKEKKKG